MWVKQQRAASFPILRSEKLPQFDDEAKSKSELGPLRTSCRLKSTGLTTRLSLIQIFLLGKRYSQNATVMNPSQTKTIKPMLIKNKMP
jgi:hypothetical protein